MARRDPVDHPHFRAPFVVPVLGALVSAVFRCLGGLLLWGINFAVTRRTGTVVAEQDLTPEDR